MQKKSIISILFWIITLQVFALVTGIMTGKGLVTWYSCLQKSALTPPGIIFSIVWPILYVLLAIAGHYLFVKRASRWTKEQVIYLVQLLLNFSWSPVFFILHWIDMGVLIIFLMIILTSYLGIKCIKHSVVISYLLLPYLIWLIFAFYLNFYIFLHN